MTFVAVILAWSIRKGFLPAARDVVPEPASRVLEGGDVLLQPERSIDLASKREGFGYTMNFADKVTWVAPVGTPLIALVPALLLRIKWSEPDRGWACTKGKLPALRQKMA